MPKCGLRTVASFQRMWYGCRERKSSGREAEWEGEGERGRKDGRKRGEREERKKSELGRQLFKYCRARKK